MMMTTTRMMRIEPEDAAALKRRHAKQAMNANSFATRCRLIWQANLRRLACGLILSG